MFLFIGPEEGSGFKPLNCIGTLLYQTKKLCFSYTRLTHSNFFNRPFIMRRQDAVTHPKWPKRDAVLLPLQCRCFLCQKHEVLPQSPQKSPGPYFWRCAGALEGRSQSPRVWYLILKCRNRSLRLTCY